MALCFLFPLLVLFLHPIFVNAAFSLSSELTKFIPGCAQLCFESFLNANYDESTCGQTPTLQCLCSNNSTSGYTIGEGAVSCILSEDNVHFCTGNDAQEIVVVDAFQMCNGLPNALPNTHSTLTATLVMGPSGVVLVPSATTTNSLTSSSRSTTTTSTTSTLLTITSSPSRTAAITSSSSAAPSATQTPSVNTGLPKNQIVGISVAAVGGAGVVGLIVLMVFLRRRRLLRRGSDTLPFQPDPPAQQMYFSAPEKKSQRWWGNKASPPPVPPRLEISPPNMFSRRSIIPDNIGLAISPERSDPFLHRSSKLLPDKPNLIMELPGESLPLNQLQMKRPLIPSTQSTATQFEEDSHPDTQAGTEFRNNLTTIEGSPSEPRNHIARQVIPNIRIQSGNSRSINQDPYSGRNLAPDPDIYVKPLNMDKGFGSFSKPRPSVEEAPQLRNLEVPTNLRPVTQSSSIYSQQTPHSSTYPPFYNAPGTGHLSLNFSEENAQAYAKRPTSYKQVGSYDRVSASSLTSFESENSVQGTKDLSLRITSGGWRKSVTDLSPVAGSPASGKSPVSYPKIPAPVRLTAQTMKTVPPPPQPDFGSVFSSRSNPSVNLQNKPWRAAEIDAQRQRNLRRDDLRLSRATRSSPQLPKPDLLPAAQIRERMNAQLGQRQIIFNNPPWVQYNNANALIPLPSQQQSLTRPPHSQPQAHQQPRLQFKMQPQPQPQPWSQYQSSNLRPGALLRDHSRSNSTISANSTSSSLLAKRLGADKAATLQLTTKLDGRDKAKTGWRVLRQDEIEAAKDPGWRPQLVQQIQGGGTQGGRYNNAPNASNGDMGPESGGIISAKSVRFDVEAEKDGADSRPPVTPGWVPKLTPTRRGDELFLSVQ